MRQPKRRGTVQPAKAAPPGVGAILVAGRSREAVAEEILRRVRTTIVPAELWLVDRETSTLRRPPLGKLQQRAEIILDEGDSPASWPDVARLPGPSASPALAALAEAVEGPALARALRAPEADAGEIHGWLVAPHAGRRPPVTLDRNLAAAAAQAGAVLSNLEALWASEQRVSQLSSLYEAAHELSADLDVGSVFDAVCARARAMTGADLAYLMVFDPARGEGQVRATDGVRSEAFKTVKLGLGLGLGGLVLKEGRPYYSSDYVHDGRFVHVVDSIVVDEGIVSVMGVPLKSEDAVIGVLFAAYRRMTTFSGSDVAYLESLAEHAAIAIANARLHDRTQKALGRERRAHRVAEKQRAALEAVNALHAKLTELVLAEPSRAELLEGISDALGCGVELRDDPPSDAPHVPVGAGATVLGFLCAPADDLGPQERQGLEQAARVVAVHMLRERAVMQAQYRLRGEFLDELLSADERSRREVVVRGSYIGVDLTKPVAVLFFVSEGDADEDDRDKLGQTMLELAPTCLMAARFGGGVILAPGKDPKPFADQLADRLAARRMTVTIGYAPEPVDVDGIADALAEARRAVRGARALGRTGEVVSRDALGVYGILLLEEGGELVTFAERVLAPLLDYDTRQNANLVETLDVYLDCGGNVTEAARRLILHVNSLYYRLGRIRELGDYDLDDAETRFELQLALRALRAARHG